MAQCVETRTGLRFVLNLSKNKCGSPQPVWIGSVRIFPEFFRFSPKTSPITWPVWTGNRDATDLSCMIKLNPDTNHHHLEVALVNDLTMLLKMSGGLINCIIFNGLIKPVDRSPIMLIVLASVFVVGGVNHCFVTHEEKWFWKSFCSQPVTAANSYISCIVISALARTKFIPNN